MIKFEAIEVFGWEAAIRGMRNSWGSHEKSDSRKIVHYNDIEEFVGRHYEIGDADLALMKQLAGAGASHAKYRRYINVTVDITAPLYWWKEFDTYKVGTVANSESTMHTVMKDEFYIEDFSNEHLDDEALMTLSRLVYKLNCWRLEYITTEHPEIRKRIWYKIIQLLPSSFNQRRTVQLNYEVLAHIWKDRKNHKLDEWREGFCKDFIQTLPYSEGIIWN
jgi:hypothetical protein